MRERLLDKVCARLNAVLRGAHRESLLSRDALSEVVELLAHRRRGGVDVAVMAIAGRFFLFRCQVQRGELAFVERVIAFQLLGPVYALKPDGVPPALREFFEQTGDPWAGFSWQTCFTNDPMLWFGLSREPDNRYLATDDLADLRLAIDILRLARVAGSPDGPDLLKVAKVLATRFTLLRVATHERQACVDSAEAHGFVLGRMQPDDPDRSLMLAGFGLALVELAGHDGDVAAAEMAIKVFRGARCEGLDEEDGHSFNLAGALAELGRLTGDAEPLYEALQMYRDVADRVGESAIVNLEIILSDLCSRGSEHRSRVAAFCRASLPPPTSDGADDLPALRMLCVITLEDAGRDGDVAGMREAVRLGRRVLAVAEDDEGRGEAAHNTANALRSLAQRNHDPDLAREAVALARVALEHAPRAETLAEAVIRSHLARCYLNVHELVDDLEALREALHESRLAVAALADDDPWQEELLSNHATILHQYAGRIRKQDLMLEALAALTRAGELPDLPDGRRAKILVQIARVQGDIFYASGGKPITMIQEAVQLAEQARALTPPGEPDDLFALSELVRVQRLFGEATRDAERLRTAVGLADQVLASAGSAVPGTLVYAELERAITLASLASLTRDPQVLSEAFAGFGRVMDSPHARLDVRTRAAVLQVGSTILTGDQALDQLENAVELLRLNVTLGPLWADRENVLRDFSGLTGRIIAAGLAADDPVRTVELIERSRGLLSEDAMDIRADLHGLDPALADELRQISASLRTLDRRDRSEAAEPDRRRDLDREIAHERAELIQRWKQARRTAALATMPPEPAAAAMHGPIAMIAATEQGGYALLVTADPERPVRVVELPELGSRTATDRVLTFLTARHYATSDAYTLRVRRIAQAEVRDTLDWLWRSAAEPILAELGLTTSLKEGWPHMWWCPLGLLSYLPWHAAGSGVGDSVLDRVVSSYTPSLRALDFVRRMPRGSGTGRTLIVAQAEAPSAPPLRGVAQETEWIRRWLPDASVLADAKATKAAFLDALASHAIVHLACHAMTDIHSPGMSRLLLADHETAPLTVAELAAIHLPGRELAVLSACSTSEISPDLTDEALHLTGAFQLAGFRHVIGALWPVSDATAGEVADALYARLTDSGRHAPRTEDSALALHLAIRGLRERYAAAPTVWASYIHTGA